MKRTYERNSKHYYLQKSPKLNILKVGIELFWHGIPLDREIRIHGTFSETANDTIWKNRPPQGDKDV